MFLIGCVGFLLLHFSVSIEVTQLITSAVSSSKINTTWTVNDAQVNQIYLFIITTSPVTEKIQLDKNFRAYQLTGLKANERYEINIQISTLFELGAPVSSPCTTCPGVPDPVVLTDSEVKGESITVFWQAPLNYYGTPGKTALHLWSLNGGTTQKQDIQNNVSKATFSPLMLDKTYYVSIKAKTEPNADSCGGGYSASQLAGAFLLGSTDSLPLESPSCQPLSASKILCEWAMNDKDADNVYMFKCILEKSNQVVKTQILAPTIRRLVLSNLDSKSEYIIKINAYGIYTPGVVTSLKVTTWPGVPSQPTDLTIETTVTSISASWSGSAGADIYKVELFIGSNVHKKHETTSTTYKFDQLEKNIRYSVGITAITKPDSNGYGGGSSAILKSNFIDLTPIDELLGMPRDIEFSKLSPTAMVITWNKPTIDEVGIFGYKIEITDPQENTNSYFNPPEPRIYTLTDLKPATKYRLQMQTTSISIQSSKSSVIYIETAYGAPSSPVNLTAIITSLNVAKLTWKSPLELAGGIQSYKIGVYQGANELLLKVVDGSLQMIEVKDLPSMTEIYFTLSAKSIHGLEGEAAVSNFIVNTGTERQILCFMNDDSCREVRKLVFISKNVIL